MKTVRTPRETRREVSRARASGARIGFVPTMGALHEGHASLVRAARGKTDFVVASIFVNPRQFGPREDLSRYPRRESGDAELLDRLGCDLLFLPDERDIYSSADRTRIHVKGLSEVLCGAVRPGHFDGVSLVVAKLFNIVQPDEAFFGQKDAQQAVIIQRMTADLDFPVRIALCPTMRDADGLALSSRNAYLEPPDRARAPGLYRALVDARRRIEGGQRDAARIEAEMRRSLEEAGFTVEYASIVDGATLEPLREAAGLILIAAAGRLGGTRLIDNIALRIEGSSVGETLLEFPEWSRYGSDSSDGGAPEA